MTPIDIKPNKVLHMVVAHLCAKFRSRTTRRLEDRPQRKYLVDFI